jgi:imidazolonepropionase-like amidohydrolase
VCKLKENRHERQSGCQPCRRSQILFGTDAGYTDACDTSEEYRLMSAALGWRQILAALTTAPAARFGFADSRGRIAPGTVADLAC